MFEEQSERLVELLRRMIEGTAQQPPESLWKLEQTMACSHLGAQAQRRKVHSQGWNVVEQFKHTDEEEEERCGGGRWTALGGKATGVEESGKCEVT